LLVRALVHDKPLASGIGAAYDGSAFDLSSFWIFASPRDGTSPAELETAIEATLLEILRDGLPAEEVERAKARTLDQAIFARDGVQAAPRAFGVAFTTGKDVAWVESWPARIAAVTPERVNAALRAILSQDGHTTGLLLPKPGS
jgi:zinc protease